MVFNIFGSINTQLRRTKQSNPLGKILQNKDEYLLSLKNFNNIRFTDREVEVIACYIATNSTKKIAQLLSVSPNTITIHIRNILLKICANTSEKITTFIKKSGQYNKFKYLYYNILSENILKDALIAIENIIKDKMIKWQLYYQADKSSLIFIEYLEKFIKSRDSINPTRME